jgi:cytochrome c5
MKITKKTMKAGGAAVLLVAAIAGCRTSASLPARVPHGTTQVDQSSDLSGSQLWGQMCGLCHNAPSPKEYSDTQWEVIVMHMRVQARLTGEEERKIVQFLKASN